MVLKNRTWQYHLLFWAVIYSFWVLAFRSYSFPITKTLTIEFCYLLFITADYYAVSSLIVPQLLLKKKYFPFVAATVTVIFFSAWLRALVAVQMNLLVFHPAVTPDFATLYFNSIVNISFWVLIITLGKMLVDRIQNQRQLELLEQEKRQNELDFLKAQINPHALFNSLNTIYGQIDKSNQQARNTLLQFSELLRYQLYDCSAEKVSLQNEIDYIKNYTAFQQLRKEDHLSVQLDIGNIEKDLQIAPLMLVVLIENAFKFVSSSTEKKNKIVVRLFTDDFVLHCVVINTIEPNTQPMNSNSNGIGVGNLKRRLELLYPNKYEFTIGIRDGVYEANLTIDLS